MRKFTIMLAFMMFLGMLATHAQNKVISGKVTSAEDGTALPGVTVLVSGTSIGTSTDIDGKYQISAPATATSLIFSFIGKKTVSVVIGGKTVINVTMEDDAMQLEEVVVTALGISRTKKSLGYATQEVSGEDMSRVKTDNLINSISGKVSGVEIKNSGNLGGSTNIVMRGSNSLTGSNQVLFIVDGVPMTNSPENTAYQRRGGAGFDYGSVVSDINPDNIKSINILKGAAATALYGARAANGVIIITTKRGSDEVQPGTGSLGISFSSNVTAGFVDPSTFLTYQDEYGAGYGPYYSGGDHPGLYEGPLPWTGTDDVLYVPTTEDASYGEKFDPNLQVYQWNSFVPESPNYQKKTPWVNAANGPITFFNTTFSTSNTLTVSGAGVNSDFRLSYTNYAASGLYPNSKLDKNSFSFSSTYDVTKKITVSSTANYVNQATTGRNATGYADNIISCFRQWWQTNVDLQEQKDIYDETGKNYTWNMSQPENGDLSPIYWNNFYWERDHNYQSDNRDHLFGNVQVKWDFTDYLSVTARASIDNYSQIREERKGYGSVSGAFGIGLGDVTSGYGRRNLSGTEVNYDLMANFQKDLSEKLNLSALLGTNMRRNYFSSIYASTNGGLIVPELFSIANSASPPLAPEEIEETMGVNGVFASASLGFDEMLYLDATIRRDQSSTLPADNNIYYYPSISGSFIFSKLVQADWLPFAKARLNYAQVGNDAPFASLYDNYAQPSPFGGVTLFSVPSIKNNSELVPERTNSTEAGVEMAFLKRRLGFDVALYKTNTINQIMPVAVSTASGYSTKYVNSGEVENKGIELSVYATPAQTKDFSWNVTLNWSANRNMVISLFEGVDNLQLRSFQGGLTINATVGEPYGTIQGRDFVYYNDDPEGDRIVDSNSGYWMRTSTTNNVLGDINPLWRAGMYNTFMYKNWGFGFLIDMQHGGSIFSLDQYYGGGTGL